MLWWSWTLRWGCVWGSYSLYLKPCWRKWWSSLFLKEFIVLHCTTEGGSLFHFLKMSLVKKNFVQSRCIFLHLSFTPLLLVRDESSVKNSLLASTFINPLSILKHSVSFPQRWHFLREDKFSSANLSSYDLLHKEGIVFVALHWTASNFAMSSARWGDQNCTAYSKCGLTKLL